MLSANREKLNLFYKSFSKVWDFSIALTSVPTLLSVGCKAISVLENSLIVAFFSTRSSAFNEECHLSDLILVLYSSAAEL